MLGSTVYFAQNAGRNLLVLGRSATILSMTLPVGVEPVIKLANFLKSRLTSPKITVVSKTRRNTRENATINQNTKMSQSQMRTELNQAMV